MRYEFEGISRLTLQFSGESGNKAFSTIQANSLSEAIAIAEKRPVDWKTVKVDGNYVAEKIGFEWMNMKDAAQKREEMEKEIPEVFR